MTDSTHQLYALDLQEHMHLLSEKDRSFAQSLIDGFYKYGRFSDRQEPWVIKLIDRAKRESRESGQPKQSLDLTKINEMFDTAKGNGLKRMSLRFLDEAGAQFSVSPAAATSRNAGMLYVKSADDGYLGKIDQQGVFHGAWNTAGDATTKAQAALVEFSRDPVGKSKLYGKLTNSCCYCGKELNDPRSVMAGYGPICADNWGLPIPTMAEAKAWVAAQVHA